MARPSAFLVHEHSSYTSAIDKYWLFVDAESAKTFFNELVKGYKDSLDLNHYRELDGYEDITDCNDALRRICAAEAELTNRYVCLTDDNYLVLSSIDSSGYARRP